MLVAPPDEARAARDELPDLPIDLLRAGALTAPSETVGIPVPRRRVRRRSPARWLGIPAAVLGIVAVLAGASALHALTKHWAPAQSRTLKGDGNNVGHPSWGTADEPYRRVTAASYADGIKKMYALPSARYISNRVFNDRGQNLFSENDVSQWGWVWGQFLDHTFGLRNEKPGEKAPIPFDSKDPLERFRNDLGVIDFSRTPAAPGTGVSTPRQEINTVPSFIDAFAVYGDSEKRLEWLRSGPFDGNLADNGATLMLPGGYLPHADVRGNVAAAPQMDLMGPLAGHRANAIEAGDVRANENIALTATHTLFAREHNRIVSLLPTSLSAAERFEIARRIVGAEEQYITYTQFLSALGVHLSPYRGYNPNANPTITNEFATVGYRVHSMVHGEFEPQVRNRTYTPKQLEAFERVGIEVEHEGANEKLVIPLGLAFGNPDLLQSVGLGPLLKGLGEERQYKNDEQIDESLRSVLFQIPKPGKPRPGKLRHADGQAGVLLGRPGPGRDRRRARPRPRHPVLQRAPDRVRARPETLVHRDHGRVDVQLPSQPLHQPPRPDRRPEHPRLHVAQGRQRRTRSLQGRGRRGGRHGRGPADDARRTAEGDLRSRERKQGRCVRRDALRGARPRNRVRSAPARDVEAAIRGVARRRPLSST